MIRNNCILRRAHVFRFGALPLSGPGFPLILVRSSFSAPRSSLLVPRSSFLAPRSSLLVPRLSLLVPCSSVLAPRSSRRCFLFRRQRLNTDSHPGRLNRVRPVDRDVATLHFIRKLLVESITASPARGVESSCALVVRGGVPSVIVKEWARPCGLFNMMFLLNVDRKSVV